MRVNLVLEEQLDAKGMRMTRLKTRRALLDFALRELIRRGQQRAILKLRGQVKGEANLNQLWQGRFADDLG